MKNWKKMILSIAMFVNANFAISDTNYTTPKIIDKIAAIVNNDVVLESDIDNLIQSLSLHAGQVSKYLQNDATLRYQILERLILDQIVLQIGQEIDIKVTDEQIDQAITNIAKHYNITKDQIKNRLACNGISYKIYRNQIRREIMISAVSNNEVRPRIVILPQEINALAKQINNYNDGNTELKLSHILIPLPKNPTINQINEAENKSYCIIDQARNGIDFNKLAIMYSAVKHQVLKSEQINWERIQNLPPTFAKFLGTAKKNDIFGPIRSETGFHILKVNDIRVQNHNILITEIHARHILLKESPIMTADQASTKLKNIATDIKNGKVSFADAAKKFSQDFHSNNQGGDLGWSTIDIYDPAFRNALIKLNKGQISAPVRSSFGWHLIELLDIRNVDKTDVIQKDLAYRIILNRKFSEETDIWIQEQRSNSYVKVLNK